jgi:hypothetical protein
LKSRTLQIGKDQIKLERVSRFNKFQVSKITRTMDKALLNEHMTLVYNALYQEEAGILLQLRTGHTPLNDSLACIGACWNYKFMGLFSPNPSDELLRWLCYTLKELLRSYGSCKLLRILQILQSSANSNYCCVYRGDLCPTKLSNN